MHGDLKLANFLWTPQGAVSALLDFDTYALGAYPAEMADAFRSWCGVVEEDATATFRVDLLEAAWKAYRESSDQAWTFFQGNGVVEGRIS